MGDKLLTRDQVAEKDTWNLDDLCPSDQVWEEYYKNDQKLKALQRERTKLKTDRDLYKKIGNIV